MRMASTPGMVAENKLTCALEFPILAAQQLNQIQRIVGTTATDDTFARYDDNGNLKKLCEANGGSVSATATDCSGTITTSMAWDGLEELVSLSKAGSAALNEAYAYDDAGRRLRKTSGATTTHYLYDGTDIVGEWNGVLSGAPGAVYAHGSGSDDPLMRLTGDSGGTDAAVSYYEQDGIGSVSALASVGAVVNLAQQAGNTLSTSGDYYSAYYMGSYLKDGVTTLANPGWVGYIPYSPAVIVTVASATAVDHVDMMANNNYLPSSFVVETKNPDGSWTQIASGGSADFTPSTDGVSWHVMKSFPPVTTTALRLRFFGGTYVWLTEVQVWSALATANTQRFDSWGNLLQATGSIPMYGYTGREPDQSGLTYYRARYYHPGLGRFVSRDPMGLAAGINPYAYAGDNPVNFNDPGGLLAANPFDIQQSSSYSGEPIVVACAPMCAGVLQGIQINNGAAAAGALGGGGYQGLNPQNSSTDGYGVDLYGNTPLPPTLAQQFTHAIDGFTQWVSDKLDNLIFAKPPQNVETITNPPQSPVIPESWVSQPGRVPGSQIFYPPGGDPANGERVRVMPSGSSPIPGYENGYWIQWNGENQRIDPSTGKPGRGIGDTHIPLPLGGMPPSR